jgi:hypothetical protein
MERKARVELFEQIRREYEFGEGTGLGIARHIIGPVHLGFGAPLPFAFRAFLGSRLPSPVTRMAFH